MDPEQDTSNRDQAAESGESESCEWAGKYTLTYVDRNTYPYVGFSHRPVNPLLGDTSDPSKPFIPPCVLQVSLDGAQVRLGPEGMAEGGGHVLEDAVWEGDNTLVLGPGLGSLTFLPPNTPRKTGYDADADYHAYYWVLHCKGATGWTQPACYGRLVDERAVVAGSELFRVGGLRSDGFAIIPKAKEGSERPADYQDPHGTPEHYF